MPLKPPPDQDIVVVGATGDLAHRKLLPALYNLGVRDLLPAQGKIIGAAPFGWSDDKFRDFARDAVTKFSRTGIDNARFGQFAQRLRFAPLMQGDDLSPLQPHLTQHNRIVYLAVPPSAFEPLITGIGAAGLADTTRIIIEKPFGHDLASARDLNALLHRVVPEDRIYRIDHYMGKETVQNLIVLRFGNAVFARLWNRDAIERVEITVAEELSVDGRGPLYEQIGALRDIVQNHMFQLLALTTMEPPNSFDAEALRNEKVKVLNSIIPIDPRHVVRGQYATGEVNGERVDGYREEPGVSPGSNTETFVALRLELESWRFSGVPFFLRTGKRLPDRDTRIVIVFRDVALHLFRHAGVRHLDSNRLVVRIQPDEGITLRFVAKRPGPDIDVEPVDMDFSYDTSFRVSPPEAYERLLHDAMVGDHTLFIREDEVEAGWAAVAPVLAAPPPVHLYAAGTWGPSEADAIPRPWHWHNPEPEPEQPS
ncbi:MAG: glucose-6-phosphate dehydrogenase [Candidatus Dormibacteraeota bacterium]|nr:glucose-6-phosphate dehydrogenase [Candidatus Dormibacteraeota bacterium]